tara:strand:- start:11075 stop:11338 length:264 start_codon:yes stop_codon:yes gene_type:complete
MPTTYDIDDVITVDETIEKGYFYLENRQFHGPFESEDLASKAALENCNLKSPGECRAIYHGSTKRDLTTKLNAPMSDMRQTASVECP